MCTLGDAVHIVRRRVLYTLVQFAAWCAVQCAMCQKKGEKVYEVQVQSTLNKNKEPGIITQPQLDEMEQPLKAGSTFTEPATVKLIGPPDGGRASDIVHNVRPPPG